MHEQNPQLSATEELKQWVAQLITLRMDTAWIDQKLQELYQNDPLEAVAWMLVTYRKDLLDGMASDEAAALIELLTQASGTEVAEQAKVYGAVLLLEGYLLGLTSNDLLDNHEPD